MDELIRVCRSAGLSFACVLAIGCGRATFVDGNVSGTAFTVSNAVAFRGMSPDPSDNGTSLVVVLTPSPVACAAPPAVNSQYPRLWLELRVWDGTKMTADVTTGIYQLAGCFGVSCPFDPSALQVGDRNGSGQVVVASVGPVLTIHSGTVNLTKVKADSISGELNLKLENGDSLTGAFTSPICP